MKTFSVLVLALMLGMQTYSQDTISKYKISNKYSVEGDGSWDYISIDDSTHHLFISHGTIVQVLDANSGKIIATIPDTKGVHGIAIAKDLNKGFISNGKDTSVTVFDLKTLTSVKKIKITGINPDAILYEPFTRRVFTFNGRSNNATVIDAKTDIILGTIALSGKPEFAVSDGNGTKAGQTDHLRPVQIDHIGVAVFFKEISHVMKWLQIYLFNLKFQFLFV